MKVSYRTEHYEGGYPTHKYFDEKIEFCCEEMKDAWDESVQFGSFDSDSHCINNAVNISKCDAYPECTSWTDYPIKFCPFCGQKIDVIEIKHIDYVKVTKKEERSFESWEEKKET